MASDNYYIALQRVESLTVSDIRNATSLDLDALRHTLDIALRMITTEERARATPIKDLARHLPTRRLEEDKLHEHS